MNDAAPRVVVIGAGIAGLATAFQLRQRAREAGRKIQLTVLEAGPRHGGATRTDHIDGYVCEWGPNGFLDNEPATLDLVKRAGLEDDLVKADENSANRYIYHGGKMRAVPTKPPAFLAGDILPLSAKLRMALELAIPARDHRQGDETVDSFGRRRLGRAFAELMLDPMVSGIFAGNTKELSLKAVFPKMVAMEEEYGGLFKAMIGKQREAKRNGTTAGGPGGPNAVLHTFKHGMGQLPDRLAEELGDVLHVNTPVAHIDRLPDGVFRISAEDRHWDADQVILALPSFAAARLIDELDRDTATALRDIEHAPVDVVCHGHPDAHLTDPLRGFGVLIPRSQGIRALGSLWSDAIFPGQAPGGHRLFRTIIGGAHDPGVVDLTEPDLHRVADDCHETVMGITGEPSFAWSQRHRHGIAQYTTGHLDRVAKTEALERTLPGLFFTGASYRGVSVNGCAKDAVRVTDAILEQFTQHQEAAA